ncbi:hypothetical protein OG746_13625 [Streptomyces sp. NBC_01016]|uniref:hypothetical protein n=1 Tax=Streptomyces sp. NBC_01016 TaxID=2903720 RepID=UPI00225771E7|nr:hypothetical protein [Streptomyces sp. NBC_01016]MCX4829770.1 hypothetical protein [Streptomyces sp. NBC_01016]
MSVFGEGAFLDLFLSRGRMLALVSVPVWWSMTVFLLAEEGWHYGLVLGFVLPLFVAYLGLRGYQEVRPGMTAGALALSVATPLVIIALGWLEGR